MLPVFPGAVFLIDAVYARWFAAKSKIDTTYLRADSIWVQVNMETLREVMNSMQNCQWDKMS
jgi:hypothetical protein